MSSNRVNAQAIQSMSPGDQAKFAQARDTLQRATQHQPTNAPLVANDNRPSGNAAMRQLMFGQDRQQPALSPTDRFNGRTALEPETPKQGVEVSAPTQAPRTPSPGPSPSRGISR